MLPHCRRSGLLQGGFHAHLQDVAHGSAGVLQGLTNSCSIVAGIAGTWLTGVVVEHGSFTTVFGVLAVLYLAAAVVWVVGITDQRVSLQAP